MDKNLENTSQESKNTENIEKIQSKRIIFDEKSLKRIEMMLPAYKDSFKKDLKDYEQISALIQLAVQKLFENDFPERIKSF